MAASATSPETETGHKAPTVTGTKRHQSSPPVYAGGTADYSGKDQHSVLYTVVSQAVGGSNYPRARGSHQALVVSPSSLVWKV